MNLDKNFKFKKKYGQNFLKDKSIINKIVDKSNIDNQTLVIEIGPGSGELTKELAKKSKQVISFEIDETLKYTLDKNLDGFNNVEIVFKDFMQIDLTDYINKYDYKKLYVVANLPYYITTPIVNRIIDSKVNIEKVVIMVQKEVGERFSAKPGHKEYGSITVYLNYYFFVNKIIDVPRKCFMPQPNVDSVVLELIRKESNYNVDEEILFKLIKDSFQMKRKNLNNNLKHYENIKEIFEELNIPLSKRAEELSLKEFIDIANKIKEKK